ncbi:YhjD/YihY/BrkB family envelope integrity protein [Corynebacterium breve]|uniref:YhjD/YihY/BrkB family envelope integrity protein n=1 Tax=Corynebacterium breve TaxID=3049799 RepID=A0ABY8VEY0_9CORY|nr:YhjD/YihY/BrkB family envelope integrity protein [Corynebacterium breve]WIM68205.1 YhjD/YihY/BrkB family envelope integrity protein [Corynebacterium breve]
MATRTKPQDKYTDDYGIEREHNDNGDGVVEKVRDRAPVIDHIMRMVERFGHGGGNQFSAGITYFSVMSIFPLAMLLFAALGAVLANRPDLLAQIQDQITQSVQGDLGTTVNEIVDQAIASRGAVAGVGALTALWSGLGWMNNLRAGIGAMWNLDPTEGGNFVKKKLMDLVALIGLLIALIIAFLATAIGSGGWTTTILGWIGLDQMPGIRWIVFGVAILVGILANFLVMAWLIIFLPRTKVPRKSGLQGALLGAVLFEVIKQLSTVIVSSASGNPAGAAFGPIITLMVMLYLIWRLVMYVSAWTATTEESLAIAPVPVPDSAVIRVRNEVRQQPDSGRMLGVGAALGAIGAGAVALLRRK